MSDHINDGGQAFPSHPMLYSSADQHEAQGMSLRGWFAGQALAGLLASGQWHNSTAQSGFAQHISESALEIADAMLVALRGGAA